MPSYEPIEDWVLNVPVVKALIAVIPTERLVIVRDPVWAKGHWPTKEQLGLGQSPTHVGWAFFVNADHAERETVSLLNTNNPESDLVFVMSYAHYETWMPNHKKAREALREFMLRLGVDIVNKDGKRRTRLGKPSVGAQELIDLPKDFADIMLMFTGPGDPPETEEAKEHAELHPVG